MAVHIRLARTGRKNLARFRIVAADSKFARDGRYLENLGTYNPQSSPKQFTVKHERVAYWMKEGAIPSGTVLSLLKQDRFFERAEAIAKGIDPATLNVTRKPDAVRKPKKKADAPAA